MACCMHIARRGLHGAWHTAQQPHAHAHDQLAAGAGHHTCPGPGRVSEGPWVSALCHTSPIKTLTNPVAAIAFLERPATTAACIHALLQQHTPTDILRQPHSQHDAPRHGDVVARPGAGAVQQQGRARAQRTSSRHRSSPCSACQVRRARQFLSEVAWAVVVRRMFAVHSSACQLVGIIRSLTKPASACCSHLRRRVACGFKTAEAPASSLTKDLAMDCYQ